MTDLAASFARLPQLAESGRAVPLKDFEHDELFFSITDQRGIIEHANAVFVRLSGYSFEELHHQPHSIIREPAMPRGAFRLIWDELLAGRHVASYVTNRAQDGTRYEVFATQVPIENGFLSIRVKPDSEGLRDQIIDIYDRAREVERRVEGGARAQAAAGAEFILAALAELGFPDMATFTRKAIAHEITATLDAIDKVEDPKGPDRLEVLLRKIHLVGGLLLEPLRTLEQVEQSSNRLASSFDAARTTASLIEDLEATLREGTESLLFTADQERDLNAIANLTRAGSRAQDGLQAMSSAFATARAGTQALRLAVETLTEQTAVFALKNQMIGSFAGELLNGETVEPPGEAMRLLHQALSAQFDELLDGIELVNRMLREISDPVERARTRFPGITPLLTDWCDAAAALLGRQEHTSDRLFTVIRQVRAQAQAGLPWIDAESSDTTEHRQISVKIDEQPIRATLKFIGIVTADIA